MALATSTCPSSPPHFPHLFILYRAAKMPRKMKIWSGWPPMAFLCFQIKARTQEQGPPWPTWSGSCLTASSQDVLACAPLPLSPLCIPATPLSDSHWLLVPAPLPTQEAVSSALTSPSLHQLLLILQATSANSLGNPCLTSDLITSLCCGLP